MEQLSSLRGSAGRPRSGRRSPVYLPAAGYSRDAVRAGFGVSDPDLVADHGHDRKVRVEVGTGAHHVAGLDVLVIVPIVTDVVHVGIADLRHGTPPESLC